jgi:type II secretory ATPase GspE/PulE/Tfp pilus assembly ATPase PilB-like protein
MHTTAISNGMLDLKRYAALLLTEGLTTIEEVTSVVSVEE